MFPPNRLFWCCTPTACHLVLIPARKEANYVVASPIESWSHVHSTTLLVHQTSGQIAVPTKFPPDSDTKFILVSPNCFVSSCSSVYHLVVVPAGEEEKFVMAPLIDSWSSVQSASLLVHQDSGQFFQSICKCDHVGKKCLDLSRVTGEAPCDPNGYKNGSKQNSKRWLGSLLVEQNVQLKRWLGSLFFEQNVQSKAVLRTTLRTISNDINRFWHAPKDVTYIKISLSN